MNNTYKAIRLIGSGYNLYYSVWCNNEHELYNMIVGHLSWMKNTAANMISRRPTLGNFEIFSYQMRMMHSVSPPTGF